VGQRAGEDVSAREELLARIDTAYRAAPPPEVPYEAIERGYRTDSDRSPHELTELLVDRLLDYRALVRHCSADHIAGTIASALSERRADTVVVPAGVDQMWLGETQTGIRTDGMSAEDQLSVTELDATDGVITGCAVAIAETGTFVLDGGAGQGRRALSLVPDLHICVVRAEQVVGLVPEAIGHLEQAVREGRPLTFVSGPSATSDIELNRVEGVHGPRILHVLLVS
jgi:L-lactate dehydrogenase complex protein LldG